MWQDALYMTVITVSTVAFGEVNTLSEAGRFFTNFLILSSFGVFAYCATMVVSFVFEGGINQFFQKMRMEKALSDLNQHHIVCGVGQKGRAICRHLDEHNLSFIVIERNTVLLPVVEVLVYPHIHGDNSDDHVL